MGLMGLGFVQAMVLVSYFSVNFPAVAFKGNDGWCDLNVESIGWHCFGDYHQLVNIQPGESVFNGDQEELISSQGKSPVGGLIFDFFTSVGGLLGQRSALVLWLSLLLVAIALPMWHATHGLRRSIRFIALTTLAFVTLPSWAILDRGQQQGLTIPLLFAFAVALIRGRMATAAVMAAAAALIKPQYAILFLALLAYPGTRQKVSKWWLGTITVGVLIAFAPYGYSGIQRFTSMVNQILGVASGGFPFMIAPSVEGLPYSTAVPVDLSLPSLSSQVLYRLIVPSTNLPGLVELSGSLRESYRHSLTTLLVTGALLLIIIALHKFITRRDLIIALFVLASFSMAPAYLYHVSFVIPVAAILIGAYGCEQEARDSVKPKDRVLWFAVVVSLAPIVVPLIPIQRRDSISASDLLYVDNVLPLVAAACWLVFVIRICLIGLFNFLRTNKRIGLSPQRDSLVMAIPSFSLLIVGVLASTAGLLAPSTTSYVISGGEQSRESLGAVGVGTTSSLRVYPDLFDRQLGEYQLYFGGSEKCPSAVMDFRWEKVTFASTSPNPDEGFAVEFEVVVGGPNAFLELAPDGKQVSWSVDGVVNTTRLPIPVCLTVDKAELAASPQRHALLQVRHQSPLLTILVGLILAGLGLKLTIQRVLRSPICQRRLKMDPLATIEN